MTSLGEFLHSAWVWTIRGVTSGLVLTLLLLLAVVGVMGPLLKLSLVAMVGYYSIFAVVLYQRNQLWAFLAGAHKQVPASVDSELYEEMHAGEVDLDVVDGKLVRRVGAALRVAREVKQRFGGTPDLNKANWVLAARYIQDVCVNHGVTRAVDQWHMTCRARPIVFTPLAEEHLENQFLNCDTAFEGVDGVQGWVSVSRTWWSWGVRRRVPSAF